MNAPFNHPDFAVIENHLRRARIERSVAVANFVSGLVAAMSRGLHRPAARRPRTSGYRSRSIASP